MKKHIRVYFQKKKKNKEKNKEKNSIKKCLQLESCWYKIKMHLKINKKIGEKQMSQQKLGILRERERERVNI